MADTPMPAPADHHAQLSLDASAILAYAAYLAVPMIGMLGLVVVGASTELVYTWLMTSGLAVGSQGVFANVRKLRGSVGETNGADLAQMIRETRALTTQIAGFQEYQRTRNHDIANAVTPIPEILELVASVPSIVERLDELVAKGGS